MFLLYSFGFTCDLWKTPVQLTNNSKIISLFNEYKTKNQIQTKKQSPTKQIKQPTKFIKKFSGNPFSGIFDELTKIYKKNICLGGIVDITGNEAPGGSPIFTIVDFNYTNKCYDSLNQPNSYILFDFKNHSISVSAYSIKSSNHPSPDYLQTWVLEGSNNQNEWTVLDSHTNDKSLDGKCKIGVFHIQDSDKQNQKFKYIKLRMTGESIQGNNYIDILNMEFFGQYF